ncbi:MAG: hypothetical protein JNG90_17055 [Planctomycetaceae bacterium]|nr:hypothetical protein [Planctomycetaceae bacterium]
MTETTTPATPPADPSSAAAEHQFHDYTGNRIPWYVRLIWLGFWIMAIYYIVQWTFPMLQVELTSPP